MKKLKSPCAWQPGYAYQLLEPAGKNFDPRFKPDLTPKQMLALGVFGGHYFEGHNEEFPKSWFPKSKQSKNGEKDPECNLFGVTASQPLSEWKKKDWIYEEDPHGWFQWYCRYYLGRRIPEEDDRQIKRWSAIRRHIAQIEKNCAKGDIACRPKQRQAVLHWAYDSRKI